MAALTPVASSEALVGVIQKSGLLSADALAKVSAAAEATVDPAQLARDLLKAGTLSKWQAGQLLHGYHQLTIGKYKLLDQLESGAIGRVYLAEHAQMGRRALLKVLSRRQSADPVTVKRFLTQAQQACGLDHRNISHVYDVNQDDDRNYVVVEHIEGTDLAQLVQQHGPLPLGEALEYVRQAVEGLIHAHAAEVCHGDLKPANLLLDPAGTIKIVDIGQAGLTGCAAAALNAPGVDETGEMPVPVNSPFRAPEVAAGQPADKASDIYSLGNVLCFLVTAKPAADAATAAELLRAAPGIPQALADACVKLMAEKPDERPASILDAWNLIASAEDPEGVLAQSAVASDGAIAANAPDSSKGPKPRVAQRLSGGDKNGRAPAKAEFDLQLAAATGEEESPLASLAVNVRPREAKPIAAEAKPRAARALKRAVALEPAAEPAGLDALGPLDAAPAAGTLPAAAQPEEQSVSPVLIAGALAGGGVLLLGLVVLIWMLTSGKSDTKVAANPAAKPTAGIVQPPPAAPPVPETNPQVGGETNPVIPSETNPAIPPAPPPQAPETAAALPANPPAAPPKGDDSSPAPASLPAEPPPVAKLETPGETKKESNAETKSEPKNGEKTEQKDAKTAPKAEAKPKPKAAPKAPPSPFRGFTAAVALPQLPESAGQPATDATAPQSLGPCNMDEKAPLAIALRGGATAGRSKQSFDLATKEGSSREWNFVMAGESAPVAVATLAAKDGTIVFQWTDQALDKPQDAGYLCNCSLELASGSHRHTAALRMPIEAEPLPVEIDRRGAPERWQIPFLPAPKQVFVEVAKVEGFQQLRLEPAKAVNLGEQITVWTGPDEESPLLALRIDTKASTSVVSLTLTPQIKTAGSKTTRAYSKKNATTELNQASREFTGLQAKSKELRERPPTPPKGVNSNDFKKKLDEYTKITLPNEIAERQSQIEQLKFLTQFEANAGGNAKIHFRVYHESDAGPIELLKTFVETPAKGKKK